MNGFAGREYIMENYQDIVTVVLGMSAWDVNLTLTKTLFLPLPTRKNRQPTNDKRQTTNDKRQTTNDKRQMTNDK